MSRWTLYLVFLAACRGHTPPNGGAGGCKDPYLTSGKRGEVEGVDLPTLCDRFCRLRVLGDVSLVGYGTTYRPSGLTWTLLDTEDLADLSCVTSVGGDFTLSGQPSIQSLNGLQRLRSVGGDLFLEDLHLETLSGLEGLNTAGSFWIFDARVETLEGLEAPVFGKLEIVRDRSLASLKGLEHAQVTSEVAIGDNPALTSLQGLTLTELSGGLDLEADAFQTLAGLESLRSLGGDLELKQNHRLNDLSALINLQKVGGDVTITDNPQLTDEQAQALVDGIGEVDGIVTISGNGG